MYARLTALVLGLGLSSTILKADTNSHHNFAGFNFGGQFGMGTGNTKVTRQYLLTSTDIDNTDFSTSGLIGGANIGYGWILPQQYYIGLHGHFDYAEIIGTVENNIYQSIRNRLNLKMQYMYSIYARLGKVINNVLPYVKAGMAYSNWQANTIFTGEPQIYTSKKLTGWTVGLGSDFLITKNLSLGADYSFASFRDFGLQQPQAINYKIRPKLHIITLNVRWYL